jgi:glycosyltransferase involved in cell wall biosynthesis
MRVLHVSAYFAPAFCYGGPPRSILGLCRSLRAAGVDAEVLATTANGSGELDPGRRDYEGVPVEYAPRTFPKRFFNSAEMSKRLDALLPNFDLVHVHGLWNMTVWKACSAAQRWKKPYVISPRGMLDQGSMQRRSGLKRMMYPLVERTNLSEAAIIHATSEAEVDAVTRFRLPTPIRLVPNGVDVIEPNREEGIQLRNNLGIAQTDPVVIYLGRIAPLKRLDLLAEAFERVLLVFPAAKLIVAGPDEGGHLATLRPNFARLGKAVHVLGEVDAKQKQSLFAAANVLVCCSESESFGLSIAEALGAGVPVVATINSPWSVLEEVGAGKWVSHSKEGVFQGILAVSSDSDESRRMGEAGRKLIQERYSWEGVASKTIEMYEEALASRRPAP